MRSSRCSCGIAASTLRGAPDGDGYARPPGQRRRTTGNGRNLRLKPALQAQSSSATLQPVARKSLPVRPTQRVLQWQLAGGEENHMKIINIGVLAHVDAGKTTLTESLLYNSGAITELGSVDKGTTRTDNTLLERQRGITIQTGITSFQWENTKVNIIDTPGHMDFLAEVYRSLSVLDGAILLIS